MKELASTESKALTEWEKDEEEEGGQEERKKRKGETGGANDVQTPPAKDNGEDEPEVNRDYSLHSESGENKAEPSSKRRKGSSLDSMECGRETEVKGKVEVKGKRKMTEISSVNQEVSKSSSDIPADSLLGLNVKSGSEIKNKEQERDERDKKRQKKKNRHRNRNRERNRKKKREQLHINALRNQQKFYSSSFSSSSSSPAVRYGPISLEERNRQLQELLREMEEEDSRAEAEAARRKKEKEKETEKGKFIQRERQMHACDSKHRGSKPNKQKQKHKQGHDYQKENGKTTKIDETDKQKETESVSSLLVYSPSISSSSPSSSSSSSSSSPLVAQGSSVSISSVQPEEERVKVRAKEVVDQKKRKSSSSSNLFHTISSPSSSPSRTVARSLVSKATAPEAISIANKSDIRLASAPAPPRSQLDPEGNAQDSTSSNNVFSEQYSVDGAQQGNHNDHLCPQYPKENSKNASVNFCPALFGAHQDASIPAEELNCVLEDWNTEIGSVATSRNEMENRFCFDSGSEALANWQTPEESKGSQKPRRSGKSRASNEPAKAEKSRKTYPTSIEATTTTRTTSGNGNETEMESPEDIRKSTPDFLRETETEHNRDDRTEIDSVNELMTDTLLMMTGKPNKSSGSLTSGLRKANNSYTRNRRSDGKDYVVNAVANDTDDHDDYDDRSALGTGEMHWENDSILGPIFDSHQHDDAYTSRLWASDNTEDMNNYNYGEANKDTSCSSSIATNKSSIYIGNKNNSSKHKNAMDNNSKHNVKRDQVSDGDPSRYESLGVATECEQEGAPSTTIDTLDPRPDMQEEVVQNGQNETSLKAPTFSSPDFSSSPPSRANNAEVEVEEDKQDEQGEQDKQDKQGIAKSSTNQSADVDDSMSLSMPPPPLPPKFKIARPSRTKNVHKSRNTNTVRTSMKASEPVSQSTLSSSPFSRKKSESRQQQIAEATSPQQQSSVSFPSEALAESSEIAPLSKQPKVRYDDDGFFPDSSTCLSIDDQDSEIQGTSTQDEDMVTRSTDHALQNAGKLTISIKNDDAESSSSSSSFSQSSSRNAGDEEQGMQPKLQQHQQLQQQQSIENGPPLCEAGAEKEQEAGTEKEQEAGTEKEEEEPANSDINSNSNSPSQLAEGDFQSPSLALATRLRNRIRKREYRARKQYPNTPVHAASELLSRNNLANLRQFQGSRYEAIVIAKLKHDMFYGGLRPFITEKDLLALDQLETLEKQEMQELQEMRERQQLDPMNYRKLQSSEAQRLWGRAATTRRSRPSRKTTPKPLTPEAQERKRKLANERQRRKRERDRANDPFRAHKISRKKNATATTTATTAAPLTSDINTRSNANAYANPTSNANVNIRKNSNSARSRSSKDTTRSSSFTLTASNSGEESGGSRSLSLHEATSSTDYSSADVADGGEGRGQSQGQALGAAPGGKVFIHMESRDQEIELEKARTEKGTETETETETETGTGTRYPTGGGKTDGEAMKYLCPDDVDTVSEDVGAYCSI